MERVTIMGMGVTGRAVADALLRRGVDVVALDDRPSDDVRAWSAARGVTVAAPQGADLDAALADSSAFVPAPGLPDHHPIFDAARRAGVGMISEFDLAARWDDRPAVAVTGTDGKTTVVTLIQRMLERSGIAAGAVGNTDTPWVEAIDDPSVQVFVVEASSFRLGHSRQFSPQVATWLNFGPDHLDAHRDLDTYEAAKASIWAHLAPGALAVANRDDAVVTGHATALRHRRPEIDVETFGADAPPSGQDHGVVDGVLVSGGAEVIAIDEMPRGLPHDVLNALAATASARRVGATLDAAAAVLREFDGLVHRVQLVAEVDGVRFVNDSKATTPHAAAAALAGFESIVLLAGGRNKGLAFDDMLAHVDRLVHVVAIGEAADDMRRLFSPHVPTTVATSMPDAVARAAEVARAGHVVLLSPACASYDWYRSYVHRGEDFTRIVLDYAASRRTPSPAAPGGIDHEQGACR